MGQILTAENIPSAIRASASSITLAATNLGRPTRLTVGGQQYALPSGLTLSSATTGFNGLDTGGLTANTLYHLYAVLSSGVVGLIASLAGPTAGPAGFTSAYKFLGRFRTDSGAANINTVAMDASVQPQGAGAGPPVNFTPSWSTSVAGATRNGAFYHRVGSSMRIQALLVAPTTWTGNALTLNLPSGFTVDTTTLSDGAERTVLGDATFSDDSAGVGVQRFYSGSVLYSVTTNVRIAGDAARNDVWNVAGSFPVAFQGAADSISVDFTIPIAEWAGLYT